MKILILALTNYRFTDKESGEIKEGASIEYIADRTDSTSDFGTKVGYLPLKQGVDREEISLIDENTLPAYYEVALSMKSGKDRKAAVSFGNFKMVKEVKFEV